MKYLHKKRLRASFTIETTLLMSVILPVLIALLMAGFYVHDRAKLQGAACELAARGCCLVLDEDRSSQLGKTANALSGGGTMWARSVRAQVSADEEAVSASAQGSFPFPGFTEALLSQGSETVTGSCDRKICHSAKLIRKVRGLKAFQEEISG